MDIEKRRKEKVYSESPENAGITVSDIVPFKATPKTELQKKSMDVGKGIAKTGIGIAASTMVPGSGVLAATGQGAVAAAPEAAESLAEGKPIEALADVALSGLFSGFLTGAGKYLKGKSAQIFQTKIKPAKKFRDKGIDYSVISKQKLGGKNLPTIYKNTNSKIKNLAVELKDELGAHPNATVNIRQTIDAVKNEVMENAAKYGDDFDDYVKAIDGFSNRLNALEEAGSNVSAMNLLDANNYRRTVGKHGSFVPYDATRDVKASAKIANKIFFKLKDGIQTAAKSGGENLQRVNSELSELIPIEKTINDAIGREAGNRGLSLLDVLSLTTAVGGGTLGGVVGESAGGVGKGSLGGLGLLALTRGQRSPALASMLGASMRGAARPAIQDVTKRIIAPKAGAYVSEKMNPFTSAIQRRLAQ